jgi:hypothetical protein
MNHQDVSKDNGSIPTATVAVESKDKHSQNEMKKLKEEYDAKFAAEHPKRSDFLTSTLLTIVALVRTRRYKGVLKDADILGALLEDHGWDIDEDEDVLSQCEEDGGIVDFEGIASALAEISAEVRSWLLSGPRPLWETEPADEVAAVDRMIQDAVDLRELRSIAGRE